MPGRFLGRCAQCPAGLRDRAKKHRAFNVPKILAMVHKMPSMAKETAWRGNFYRKGFRAKQAMDSIILPHSILDVNSPAPVGGCISRIINRIRPFRRSRTA
jgi:hypothetical protein